MLILTQNMQEPTADEIISRLLSDNKEILGLYLEEFATDSESDTNEKAALSISADQDVLSAPSGSVDQDVLAADSIYPTAENTSYEALKDISKKWWWELEAVAGPDRHHKAYKTWEAFCDNLDSLTAEDTNNKIDPVKLGSEWWKYSKAAYQHAHRIKPEYLSKSLSTLLKEKQFDEGKYNPYL